MTVGCDWKLNPDTMVHTLARKEILSLIDPALKQSSSRPSLPNCCRGQPAALDGTGPQTIYGAHQPLGGEARTGKMAKMVYLFFWGGGGGGKSLSSSPIALRTLSNHVWSLNTGVKAGLYMPHTASE